MATINDGGPAFPRDHRNDGHNGMTLRDYFAARAMQGLLANNGGPVQANGRSGWDFCNCTPDLVAQVSYGMADAMLKARAEGGSS